MRPARPAAIALLAGAALAVLALSLQAQDSRDTQRKLDEVKAELRSVAADRRRIEGERGEAHRELRQADEKVGESNRRLREIESQLAEQRAALDALEARRATMQSAMSGQREELAQLVRAAYAQGGDAPLKVLLAQDSVAEANRLLTYHRYLQQDRMKRIRELASRLEALDAVERDIAERQRALEASRGEVDARLATLREDRVAREAVVARLDARYKSRRDREQSLGRDAKGLEQLLRQLRAAAAKAEAERRRIAAERAAAAAAASATPGTRPAPPAPSLASSAIGGPRVGGTGWPLSGALLAGFHARMPDGRSSDGLLLGADAGTAVKTVADGSVVYAGWMTGYGLLLIVDHGGGYMSLYAHNDALLKDVGDSVKRGDPVATVGSSGGHGRPALYFELRRDGKPVDPNVWLRR